MHARNQTGQCRVLKYSIKAYKNVRQKCEPFVITTLQTSATLQKKKTAIKAVITARTPDYLLNNSCTDANNT